MLIRILALLVCLVPMLAAPAAAQDAVTEAQLVISNQIKALMQNDADTAYSLASPDIKSVYPDKGGFLAMVQKEYEPVYHAGNFAFGRSKLIGGGEIVLQEVLVSSSDGEDWTAIYEMRLMDDGSYKVNGVRMVRNRMSQGI